MATRIASNNLSSAIGKTLRWCSLILSSRHILILLSFFALSERSYALGQKIYEDNKYVVSMLGEFCDEEGTEILVQNKNSPLNSKIPSHVVEIVREIAQHECRSPGYYSFITDLNFSIRPSGEFFNWPQGYLSGKDPSKYIKHTPFFNTVTNEFAKIIRNYNNLEDKDLSSLLIALEAKYRELSESNYLYIHVVHPQYSEVWLREAREGLLEHSIYESNQLIDHKYFNFSNIFSSLPKITKKGDTHKRYQEFVRAYPRILMWLPQEIEEQLGETVRPQVIADTKIEFSHSFDASVDGLVQMKKHFKDFPSDNDFVSQIHNILQDGYPNMSYISPLIVTNELKAVFKEVYDEKRNKVTASILKNYGKINDPLSRIGYINRVSTSKFFNVASETVVERMKAQFSTDRALAISQIASNDQAWVKKYLPPNTDFSAKVRRISSILFGTDIRNAEFGDYPAPLNQIRDTVVRIDWANRNNSARKAQKFTDKRARLLSNVFVQQKHLYMVKSFGIYKIYMKPSNDNTSRIKYTSKAVFLNPPLTGMLNNSAWQHGEINQATYNVQEVNGASQNKQCSLSSMQKIGAVSTKRLVKTTPSWLVSLYDELMLNEVWIMESRNVGEEECMLSRRRPGTTCPYACAHTGKVSSNPTFIVATEAEAHRLNNYMSQNASNLVQYGVIDTLSQIAKLREWSERQEQNITDTYYNNVLLNMQGY